MMIYSLLCSETEEAAVGTEIPWTVHGASCTLQTHASINTFIYYPDVHQQPTVDLHTGPPNSLPALLYYLQ